MKLLMLADAPEKTYFEEYFEEVDKRPLKRSSISIDGKSEVRIGSERIEEWDSVYIEPERRALDFLRVLTEALSVTDIETNLTASLFIPFKKPYLMQVLSEKEASIPNTAAISTEKGLTELEKDIDFPVVAKEYSNFEMKNTAVIEDFSELKRFSDTTRHGDSFVIIQEYEQDEIFEVLYLDGEINAIKPEKNPWKADNYIIEGKYHSLSESQEKAVRHAVEAVGLKTCRLRLNGEKIMDIDSRLEIDKYMEESGKNIYKKLSKILKGDQD